VSHATVFGFSNLTPDTQIPIFVRFVINNSQLISMPSLPDLLCALHHQQLLGLVDWMAVIDMRGTEIIGEVIARRFR
jgi:hypothetical protein